MKALQRSCRIETNCEANQGDDREGRFGKEDASRDRRSMRVSAKCLATLGGRAMSNDGGVHAAALSLLARTGCVAKLATQGA